MKLLDLLMSAWAILPEQLREIQAIYAGHMRGDKIDFEAIEARLGRPLANEQQDYQIRQGGVAVLTLDGVMAPKANLFMRVSGGVSTQMAGLQIESAMADPRVTAMVLAIDSPGGSVFGTPELGATVRELSGIKPIITVSEATLASAAYWVGAAANGVFVAIAVVGDDFALGCHHQSGVQRNGSARFHNGSAQHIHRDRVARHAAGAGHAQGKTTGHRRNARSGDETISGQGGGCNGGQGHNRNVCF